MGLVIMKFAFYQQLYFHECLKYPLRTPLMVAAFMASSGVIFILMQAVATTKFMFPDGVEPGL
jgi:hypothetical protein